MSELRCFYTWHLFLTFSEHVTCNPTACTAAAHEEHGHFYKALLSQRSAFKAEKKSLFKKSAVLCKSVAILQIQESHNLSRGRVQNKHGGQSARNTCSLINEGKHDKVHRYMLSY